MPAPLKPEAAEARRTIIREQYPTAHLPTLAKQLGVSVNRLQTLASRLGVRRSIETATSARSAGRMQALGIAIRELLTKHAQRPNGAGATEVAQALDTEPRIVHGVIASMQRVDQLHGATISRRNVRYFGSAAAAAAFLQRTTARTRRTTGTTAQNVAIHHGPGPAYLPGDPIETPRTKYTIAPPPKASLRSNTYLFSA